MLCQKMKTETEMNEFNLIKLLLDKPLIAGAFGGTAGLLTLFHIITAGVGLVTVIVSLIAAIYSLIHKRNIVKEDAIRLKKLMNK